MIVSKAEDFSKAVRSGIPASSGSATMRAALLFSPAGYRLEEESAKDNVYMRLADPVDEGRAREQHEALAEEIRSCGVPVMILPGDPNLPDGVFGNNAYATIDKRLIIGSMRHAVRRGETEREDVRTLFSEVMGYEIVDLSRKELIAEMTGPLVIDRPRRVGYCGMSDRVDAAGAQAMHEALDLRLTFRFDLAPGEYHTNVVMAVLAGRVLVVHEGSFADPQAPLAIAGLYPDAVLRLTDEEKLGFAGNCIAVTSEDVFMSLTALESLTDASLAFFHDHGFQIHGVEVTEFEKAGGSLRCMVTEVF